ncbi:MAG: hypothetical protein ACRD44_18600 [Bryobacteraceae bacterium]
MSRKLKGVALLLSILALSGADKKDKFRPGAASSYPSKETQGGLTVAALAIETKEQAKPVFDKVNPYEHGLLPVLLVMQNDGAEALNLGGLTVQYLDPDGRPTEPTPAADVKYLHGARRPNMGPSPLPLPRRTPKSPLDIWEIEGMAFSVRMLPARESAHGFFYYQVKHRSGSKLLLTGMREARTGKELFFMEINLDTPRK